MTKGLYFIYAMLPLVTLAPLTMHASYDAIPTASLQRRFPVKRDPVVKKWLSEDAFRRSFGLRPSPDFRDRQNSGREDYLPSRISRKQLSKVSGSEPHSPRRQKRSLALLQLLGSFLPNRLLVAYTRLYKPLCRSVRQMVCPSVRHVVDICAEKLSKPHQYPCQPVRDWCGRAYGLVFSQIALNFGEFTGR